MATAKIIIREHANSKGLSNVYIRLVHKRRKTDIPVKNLKVTASLWNEHNFVDKKDTAILNYKITNERLKKYELIATQIINRLAGDNAIENMSIAELANEISLACFNKNSTATDITFCDYTDKLIAELQKANKYGTAECYADAQSFIKRRAGRDIHFQELNFALLKKMESEHFESGKGVNSLSFYMRTIRAIYNRATRDKLASVEFNPFNQYRIKNETTAKRAISLDDFKTLRNKQIDNRKPEYNAQQYFLFSFYCRGMNFTDMALLKVRDIVGDRLQYRRAKTGKHYSIKLTQQAAEIVNYYILDKRPDDFVFPIVKRKSIQGQRADIISQRRYYGKLLDRIAVSCNLPKGLTSYVARHSWATIAKYAGISVAVISEGLGHSDVKTTQIYLDSFPDAVMDKANELVAGLLDEPLTQKKTGQHVNANRLTKAKNEELN